MNCKMKGVKYEGKQMVMDHPLFPRFHINDADRGGPRGPPRNKMALSEQFKHNVSTQNLRYKSGSMKLLHLPPSNGYGTCVQPPPSSNAGNSKAIPPFCSLTGSSNSADSSNYSGGLNLNISLKNSEPPISGNTNDQNLPFSGNSMRINDLFLYRADTVQNYCELQLHLDDERSVTFSSFASGKLHNIRLNQSDETKCAADQVKISKFSQNIDDEEENKPAILIIEKTSADATSTSVGGNKISKATGDLSLIHDSSRLYDSCTQTFQECRVLQENKAETTMRKRHASEMDDLTCSFSLLSDNNRPPEIDRIEEVSEDNDFEAMQLGSTGKKQENSDNSVDDCVQGLHSPQDIAGVIGQRLFWKARRTIVHQQKVFAVQIFELHRLVKVQKLIAGVIYENIINLQKPSIKFPPMNKLLFVTPLESSPIFDKPKVDAVKSNHDKDGKLSLPLNAAEKRPFTHPSASNTPFTSASIPTDGKLAPSSFYPPPGNQWLVPVRSPSEGLVYKPYAGLCPPSVGFMASVCGNYMPISLSTVCGTAYGVPAMTNQGNGRFPGVTLDSQQYNIPVLSTGDSNVEIKQAIPLHGPHKNSYGSSQQSDVGEKLHGSQGSRTSSPAAHLEGDVLPLFPTTPSVLDTKDSIQVIKVVPHNPKSASESAARIFQSIQEERKRLE
ncbi:ELF3-like protein 2 isoform X1 [Primulina huaijiensis]|uniref:ELF3-like protein 2 isoform X1 n=1 Tax=Primulina huaijiensis TaxID=1492673 RepID=UPI003CC75F88